MSKGLPYAGWYNGDFEMQKANGTYADFRDFFLKKVELKKMKQEVLDAMDKEWEAIPLEERMKRRAVVVDDSTPKEKTIMTNEGPLIAWLAAPDEGNNVKRLREKQKVKKGRHLPLGALTDANSPLKSLVPSAA